MKISTGLAIGCAATLGIAVAACTEFGGPAGGSALASRGAVSQRPSINAGPPASIEELLKRPGAVLPAAATQGRSAADAVHAHPKEIRLWAGAAPGSENQTSAEIVNWRTEKDSVSGEMFSFPTVTNIHVPSLTPYLPAKGAAAGTGGACVIIAPGGGHMFLTINHEGYDIAKYFSDRGVAAIVLKYRLPRAPASTYTVEKTVMDDSLRAVRMVRAHAAEWGINPNAIGIMGFSAGGDVVAAIHAHPDDGNPAAADPIERFGTRVSFEAPIYTGSMGRVTVTKDSPPIYLQCSADDSPQMSGLIQAPGAAARPAVTGLVDVYLKYKAIGVPAEIHIYNEGGHGFGGRDRPIAEARWMDNFLAFLKDRNFKKP